MSLGVARHAQGWLDLSVQMPPGRSGLIQQSALLTKWSQRLVITSSTNLVQISIPFPQGQPMSRFFRVPLPEE